MEKVRQITKCVLASAAMFLTLASVPALAAPIVIDGITFPDGAVSFADAVVSYVPGTDVGPPYDDPLDALGLPNYNGINGAVSLGNAGTLTVQFVDNALTTSGSATPDLHIFEVGAATEFFNAAISIDGTTWLDLGNVLGQPTSIDIDAVAGVIPGALYRFVRLTDVLPEQSGPPFGEADIDAIGAISSVSTPVPEPTTLALLALGLVGARLRSRGRRQMIS